MRRRHETVAPSMDRADAREINVLRRVADVLAIEMSNLLCSIIGRSSVLEAEMESDDPARADIEAILEAGKASLALARSLTEFSDKTELVRTRLSLNEIIAHAGTLWESSPDRGIEVQSKLAADLLDIEADPARIRKVLHELGANAIEAMPNGGTLTVTTANFHVAPGQLGEDVSGLKPGDYVRLQVADTGIGMLPETVRQAFEPFFSTKQSTKVNGLGLAQVWDIVQRHSAELRLFSKRGLGTTVTIYFPALPALATARSASVEDAQAADKKTILIVDDDRLVLATGVRLLARLGYNVVSASDGQEAIRLFRERKGEFALVISDLVMPGTDGFEVIRAIKALDSTARVILCSGYMDGKATRRAADLGSDGILHKPYRLSDLASAIESVDRS